MLLQCLLFNIWHWLLGHYSISWSKFISNIDYKISFSSKILCFVCPIGKRVKFSFPFNNYKTISPFELIHCDIWGSFVILNNFGAYYFLIIVNYFYSLNLSAFLLNIINLKVRHLWKIYLLSLLICTTRVKNIQINNSLILAPKELHSTSPIESAWIDNSVEFQFKD